MMMMLKKEINKFQLRKIALCIRKRRSRACAALGTRIPARFARSDKRWKRVKLQVAVDLGGNLFLEPIGLLVLLYIVNQTKTGFNGQLEPTRC